MGRKATPKVKQQKLFLVLDSEQSAELVDKDLFGADNFVGMYTSLSEAEEEMGEDDTIFEVVVVKKYRMQKKAVAING